MAIEWIGGRGRYTPMPWLELRQAKRSDALPTRPPDMNHSKWFPTCITGKILPIGALGLFEVSYGKGSTSTVRSPVKQSNIWPIWPVPAPYKFEHHIPTSIMNTGRCIFITGPTFEYSDLAYDPSPWHGQHIYNNPLFKVVYSNTELD